MPRPLRPVADGLIYHTINRGNNRQPVFCDDGDYSAFLKALSDLKVRWPFECYGYCLMSNHFHLLLRPKSCSISRLMQSVLVSHTQRYHRFHCTLGHVWQGRFKSPVVQNDDHVLTVLRYIEANPLRAAVVENAGDYRWSSFAAHGHGMPDPLLDSLARYSGLGKSAKARQKRWSAYVHQRPTDDELKAIRHSTASGLPYGDSRWVKRLARKLNLDLTIRPRGRPRKSL